MELTKHRTLEMENKRTERTSEIVGSVGECQDAVLLVPQLLNEILYISGISGNSSFTKSNEIKDCITHKGLV